MKNPIIFFCIKDEDYFDHPADYYLEPAVNLETVSPPDLTKVVESGVAVSVTTHSSSTSSTVSSTSSKLSAATTDSKKSSTTPSNRTIPANSPKRRPTNISARMVESLNHTNIREHINSVNQEISLLDSRVENILKLTSHHRQHETQPQSLPTPFPTPAKLDKHRLVASSQSNHSNIKQNVMTIESDTEHIYETIPEDIEPEPLYCSPYDHVAGDQTPLIEEWIRLNKGTGDGGNQGGRGISQSLSHKATNKNLMLSLNGGGSFMRNDKVGTPTDTEKCQKLLQYHPPLPPTIPNTNNSLPIAYHSSQPYHHNHLQQSVPVPLPTAETMYTNVANLQQTMLLQQRLFRQALCQNAAVYPSAGTTPTSINASHKNFTAPNLSQYQFVGSRHEITTGGATATSPKIHGANGTLALTAKVSNNPSNLLSNDEIKMEWKVKRRQDGTRYIVRRPIRNQTTSTKNRTRVVHSNQYDEMSTTTEDDGTVSETKIGRFWSKEDRKKHLEKSRDRRTRQEYLIAVKNQNLAAEQNQKKQMLMMLADSGGGATSMTAATSAQQQNGIHPQLKRSLRKKNQKVSGDGTIPATGSAPPTSITTTMSSIAQSSDLKPQPTPPSIGILSVTTV